MEELFWKENRSPWGRALVSCASLQRRKYICFNGGQEHPGNLEMLFARPEQGMACRLGPRFLHIS